MLLFLLLPLVRADVYSSIPEDLYAFPKYRLAFLPGHPIHNHTAERWLRDGLRAEHEFLDRAPPPRIDPASALPQPQHPFPSDQQLPREPSPALEHMRLGPSNSYLCLIPPPPTPLPPSPDDNQAPVTPSHSWSLLQPLSGTCLYHRQAWFTYSYCHNLHVRQFRELPTTYPHPPGARVVEEDPEWESYTLGKSPTAATSVDGELAVNDEQALASNLELARQGAGQRYLVQRWSDGTVCDKTGRPREIEIQFHCSMTMTDTILFVKETRTCEYVLVIHTPRLCGEPGFKSRLEQMPEATIRCREVVDDVTSIDRSLPEAPSPYKRKARQPLPSPQRSPIVANDGKDAKAKDALDRAQDTAKLLRTAIEAIFGSGSLEDVAVLQGEQGAQESDEFFITIDTDTREHVVDGEDPEQRENGGEPVARGRGPTLEEALRAAGLKIKGRKVSEEDDQKEKEGRAAHEEL